MRLKRILLPALCLVAVALVALPIVHAANGGNFGLDAATPSALKVNKDLAVFIGKLIRTVLSWLGILFLVLMLYAGFLYMTARGDDKKVATAKSIIQGAVIGMVIIAASYALTSFVINAVSGATTDTPPPTAEEEDVGPVTTPE